MLVIIVNVTIIFFEQLLNKIMYYFPNNKIGCHNDTDCGIGGKCETLSREKTLWCNCPRLYDPLDNCKSYYYNYTGNTMHIIYLTFQLRWEHEVR